MPYELVHKPTFTNQLLMIPKQQLVSILDKIETILRVDPAPHAPVKKKLDGYKGNIYRLRDGDYRVLYTYSGNTVVLLGVGHRKDVYPKSAGLVAPETRLDPIAFADDLLALTPAHGPYVPRDEPAPEPEPLPAPIDQSLLARLRIPDVYATVLRHCETLDDLSLADVPDSIRDRVFDALVAPDYDAVLQQPDYVTGSVDDLLRFQEGELLGFLLKLSPEQEKFVTWALTGSGPTLVKGGPGTGKSTVALYRAQAMVRALRRAGVMRPRLLFTTYTNALVLYSQQLLERLMGEDAQCVEVRTADSVARGIVGGDADDRRMATNEDLRQAMFQALEEATYHGTPDQKESQRQTAKRLSVDYLVEEVCGVIEARQLTSLDAYLRASRHGRKIPLNATQRTALWQVRQAFVGCLERMGCQSWEQLRADAEELARAGRGPMPYDAVIVDEAQDLDPSALRMLVEICRAPNRLFVTADANQSIYGGAFRWSDVHEQLQFVGRTGILRANFRSTQEIGEAAEAYLAGGALDREPVAREYVHSGPQPAMRAIAGEQAEIDLLVRFLP
ncbi:MAG TPA: UvrD-helicase domain-containing protein, partial [Ktedonobacterales bacterium]